MLIASIAISLRRLAITLLPLSLMAGCVTAQPQPDYVVHFNEPFISFHSEGEMMRVTSPEDLEGTVVKVQRDSRDGTALFQGIIGGENFVLSIKRGECFDDMAGLPFSHRAILTGLGAGPEGPRELSGCARLSAEPQPRE